MPGKKIGIGSQVGLSATTVAPGAETVIGGLLSLDGPNKSRTIVDITTIGDSTNNYLEKAAGYTDPGDVTMELAFYSSDDAGQVLLATALDASTSYAFRLYRGSTTDSVYNFKAIVSEMGEAIPGRDELLTRSVTVALTGKPEGTT